MLKLTKENLKVVVSKVGYHQRRDKRHKTKNMWLWLGKIDVLRTKDW